MLYLCIFTFVFACLLHGNIIFDILEQSSFKKYTICWVCLALHHMLYLCICVFCICIFVFLSPAHVNIIFDILEQSTFQKYTTCWVFLALRHMLYLCICVFVFVYLCKRHLVISVLISLDQELSENVWFVWSKTPYSGDVTMRDGRTNERRTREDRATQPLDAGRLSFAMMASKVTLL